MITKDSIENLKTNLEIVDIISQFIELKKNGANFKACCPFHGEKTPSFVVSPSKQIFHCFGCGIGGDSVKFLMEYEKLSYPEALEKLSSMSSIPLQYDKEYKKKDFGILTKINEYYKKNLVYNTQSTQYLHSRGISNVSIEKFEIGFAPSSQDTINFINQNFLNIQDAIDFGILANGTGGLYSRFIERIIFPIYAINDKIVGYGGRTITGHNAKYINSPQTSIFNKSKLLYGYSKAKDTIYKKKEVIVSEGYLDVIMLHQAGFTNAVATLGTALTKDHLPLLRRGEPKIILAYDGDKPGLEAAFKASVLLSSMVSDFDGGVVVFENGQDPADMVSDKKIEQLNFMFSNFKSFSVFAIDFIVGKYDLTNVNQKNLALKESREYLATLNPIMEEEYSRYLSSKLNINQRIIGIQSNNIRKNQVQLQNIDISELEIIKSVLEKPFLMDIVLNSLDRSLFEIHKNEFDMILDDKENPNLRAILLNEDIKTYDESKLEEKIKMMLINSNMKKIAQIKYSDSSNKFKQIKQLQDAIKVLRTQE